MGNSDEDKSSKEGKEAKEPKTPVSQEQASIAPGTVAADWSGYQAYSPMPPHGFMASSPQPHPYMWGVQQFMPPYGTPPHPYVAMYPHGGIYAHPTIAPGSYPFSPFAMPSPNGIVEASANTPGNVEINGKSSEPKEKLPIKRSKGNLGSLNMITGKNNEPIKASGASENIMYSKSGECASEGSTEGSDANSQNDSQANSGSQAESAEPSQNGSATHSSQNGGPNPPHSLVNHTMTGVPMPPVGAVNGVPGPATNLNIGMDYWSATTSTAVPAVPMKVPAAPIAGSRDRTQPHLWRQDERELKRQRRKQSNRESARRSRLRKQAECDELAQRAEALKEENASLRAEVTRIRSEYELLLDQNASLKERLGELPGQENLRCHRDDHTFRD